MVDASGQQDTEAGANAKEDRTCTLYLYTHAELLADSICNARSGTVHGGDSPNLIQTCEDHHLHQT